MQKKQTMKKIYLYLGRRDKKGIKILNVFRGAETAPMRVEDVKKLNLPNGIENEVINNIYHNRMLWEPWIESASDYNELKKSLRERGYTNIPMSVVCINGIKPQDNSKKIELKLKNKIKKTMIR